jgi:hydroxymethylpyrimidine/phosphomethylpyrimidine kinase
MGDRIGSRGRAAECGCSAVKAALTIAGSDPSGGAGIQADLKTFHQLGVYGEAVITLITVQNTLRLSRVDVLDAELILQQIEAVVSDIPPAAAKTGALGSRAVVEAVASAAVGFTFPLVVDPVMIGKHGAPLVSDSALDAVRESLLPRSFLLMPNLPEAEALAGFAVRTVTDMERAARMLAKMGARNVLVKGGHLERDAVDVLILEDGNSRIYAAPRIATQHTHGTGCTYSAAVTAGLAQGLPLPEAVDRAKKFVTEAIRANPGLGGGSGPLNHHV